MDDTATISESFVQIAQAKHAREAEDLMQSEDVNDAAAKCSIGVLGNRKAKRHGSQCDRADHKSAQSPVYT